MLEDPEIIDENDLRYHTDTTMKIYGDETVWVGNITGNDPSSALVSLGFKNLTLLGKLSDLLEGWCETGCW